MMESTKVALLLLMSAPFLFMYYSDQQAGGAACPLLCENVRDPSVVTGGMIPIISRFIFPFHLPAFFVVASTTAGEEKSVIIAEDCRTFSDFLGEIS